MINNRATNYSVENEHARQTNTLIDANLSEQSRQYNSLIDLALIESPENRVVSMFLGENNYDEVAYDFTPLRSNLFMECLPAFVHNNNGQILRILAFDHNAKLINPIQHIENIAGKFRHILRRGIMFICMDDERVVVSIDDRMLPDDIEIKVCSNRSSGAFWNRWKSYTKVNNYLRGQVFFANGKIIKRKRTYSWKNILLPEKTKRLIHTHVEGFLKNSKQLRRLGVKGRRGLILAGPPGTGKTLLGKILANTLDTSFIWVSPRHIESPFSFKEILSLARLVSPALLFFEDIDLFAEERYGRGWLGLGELMNQLDGAIDNEDIVTIATTNRLDVVEKALRNRPGRFDRILKFEEMDLQCRRKLFLQLLDKANIATDDLDYLVTATEGYTGAQVEEIANTLYILAVNTASNQAENDGSSQSITINREIVDEAFEETRFDQKSTLGFQTRKAG